MRQSRASLHWARSCYGVVLLGDDAVAVRADRTGSRVTCMPVALSEVEATTSRRVVGCLACRESLTKWLDAPFVSARKALRVFPTLLDIQLPFPLEECVYAFVEVSSGAARNLLALAVAARAPDVAQKLDAYRQLGFDAVALDQEGLALWTQSLAEVPLPPVSAGSLRVVLHLAGAQSSMVVGRDRTFVAAYALRSGDAVQAQRLLKAAADAGEGAAPRAPVQWVLCGPEASDPSRVAALRGVLDQVPAGGACVVTPAPATFLARAVATRALLSGPLRCNLRAGALAHPHLARRTRRLQVAAAVALLIASLGLGAGSVAARVVAFHRERAAEDAFRRAADELAGFHVAARGNDAVQMTAEAVRKRMQSLAPFRRACGPSLTGLIAAAAESGSRQRLRYDSVMIASDGVRISGIGEDWKSAEPLVEMLKGRGAAVVLRRKEGPGGQGVPFEVVTEGSR